jgi:hypothetical protein
MTGSGSQTGKRFRELARALQRRKSFHLRPFNRSLHRCMACNHDQDMDVETGAQIAAGRSLEIAIVWQLRQPRIDSGYCDLRVEVEATSVRTPPGDRPDR